MAKKQPESKKQESNKPESRSEVERQLREIDREMIELLRRRLEVAQQLDTQASRGHEAVPDDLAADQQWLESLGSLARGALTADVLRNVFREILSASRALRGPVRVAYLGPMYSYSHLATLQRFGHAAELIAVPTIAAVFEELQRGHVQFGVTPIENSTDGRIVDTLDMFSRMPLRICGEVQMRIHHNLLARCPRDEIHTVCSKPQALSQCRDWLAKHLPRARLQETTSTTQAAEFAAEQDGVAAVASRQAGLHYGLEVVAAQIEDNPHNLTRFAVIGDQRPRTTGSDKTSIMFEIPHAPGSLSKVLAVLNRNRLNMTWIESFPMPQLPNEYRFFVEFEGHEQDEAVARALQALRKETVKLELLGSYPKAEPID